MPRFRRGIECISVVTKGSDDSDRKAGAAHFLPADWAIPPSPEAVALHLDANSLPNTLAAVSEASVSQAIPLPPQAVALNFLGEPVPNNLRAITEWAASQAFPLPLPQRTETGALNLRNEGEPGGRDSGPTTSQVPI